MAAMTCTQCGGEDLEPGFVEDLGGPMGFLRWIPGPLQRGPLGGARRFGKPRWQVDAYRCTHCAHLELYAGAQA